MRLRRGFLARGRKASGRRFHYRAPRRAARDAYSRRAFLLRICRQVVRKPCPNPRSEVT